MSKDVSGMAKQIAYNALFATAPLLIFVTALAGYITHRVNADQRNPVVPVVEWIEAHLPADAASVLRDPVENALNTEPGYLLSFGALLTLWGAKGAIAAVMSGLNQCYGEHESRPWVIRQLIATVLTIAVGVALAGVSAVFVLGSELGDRIFAELGLAQSWTDATTLMRWPVSVAFIILAVALLHWQGPALDASFRWFLPGAIVSVILWGVAIVGLRLYFRYVGSFAEAYGIFGAMLVFIFWLWVMGIVTLFGGIVNAALHEVAGPDSAQDESVVPQPETASS